jgi:hypothetical protein
MTFGSICLYSLGSRVKSSPGGGSVVGDNAKEFVELDALRALCLDVRVDGGLRGQL